MDLFLPYFMKRVIKRKVRGTLSGLRQFLASENPFKIIKNAFYFTLKPLFVLKVSRVLPGHFGYVEKWLD